MTLTISSEPDASPDDIDWLHESLHDTNRALFPHLTYIPVTLFLRDDAGALHGGLTGGMWGGWFHLTFLWVEEALRGQGYGTRLLHTAEAQARANACQGAFLETHGFQARPFYERYGYEVIAEIPDYPPGYGYFIMRKFFGG